MTRRASRRAPWSAGAAALLGVAAAAACSDATDPAPPPLQVSIESAAAADAVQPADDLVLLARATARDVGVLPNDSLWWTLDGVEVARGPLLRRRAQAGRQRFVLHARYGGRRGSATFVINPSGEGVGRVLWSVPLASNEWDGLSLAPDGTLYAADGLATVVAIGPDGSVRWRTQPGVAMWGAPPAIADDGTIYYSHVDPGGVIALTPGGRVKWSFNTLQAGPPGSVWYHVHGGVALGGDGTIFFATEENNGAVYAVHPDGTLKWRSATSPTRTRRFYSSPVVVGDSLVVAVREDSVIAVAAQTGAVRWTVPRSRSPLWQYVPAVGEDGSLYTAIQDEILRIRPDGSVAWRLPAGTGTTSAAIRDGVVYFSSHDAVTAIRESGQVIAPGSGPPLVGSSPTLGAHGVVYTVSADTLYSFDAAGARRFAVAVPNRRQPTGVSLGGSPVIGADGTVYFRAQSGGVIAVRDTVGPATDATWSEYMGGPRHQGRRP